MNLKMSKFFFFSSLILPIENKSLYLWRGLGLWSRGGAHRTMPGTSHCTTSVLFCVLFF
ncbi:mCG147727 [Mus musculus]|nr:mCG147727 [Mus musculus]